MFGGIIFFLMLFLFNAQIWKPPDVWLKFGLLDLAGLHFMGLEIFAKEKERDQLDQPQMIKESDPV